MCGIAGIAGPGAGSQRDLLARMLEAIVHRGPDEEGTHQGKDVLLGSRRLSIIDLAGGTQPIYGEDGHVVVVLNGEIYDHAHHIARLSGLGHHFKTRSDTEVLVHAYEESGLDFIQDIHGMFALALWDEREKRLILARDRMGKKPLYYAHAGGRLAFASELKALLTDPDLDRALDLDALNRYLTFECVPSPDAIFKSVRKLPPGTLLTFQDGQAQVKKYWDVTFAHDAPTPSFEDAARDLLERLSRAVARRLVADVPVGVFLSGGIDSSTVAMLARRHTPCVRTYSVGFTERSFDESEHARRVAEALGTEHTERILSAEDAVALLPRIVKVLDEPFADASIFPTYLLSSFTREHVKVALGGDGGDELLLGYPTYLAHRLARLYEALPGAIDRWIVRPLVKRLPVSMENVSLDFKIRRFLEGVGLPAPARNAVWLGSFSPIEKRALLTPQVRDQLADADGMRLLDDLTRGLTVKDPLERILYLDLKLYMSDDILVKVDRASMACSLEVRAPFLDTEVVEAVTRLPVDYRLRHGESKALLKAAVAPLLPKGIARRPKKGFGMPVAQWIRGPLRETVRAALDPARLAREGLFEPAFVTRLLDEHLAGRADNRKPLWTLFMFQSWLETYGKPAA